jgi:periplasmic copper chaperone A
MLLRSMFFALLMVTVGGNAAELEARSAWIRDAPAGAAMRAGYVELHNRGTSTVEIVAASSAAFGLVELHETRMVDGVARMRELPPVQILPGGQFAFVPGGPHFMLMRGRIPLEKGDRCVIRLDFSDGTSQDITFQVGLQPESD